MWRPAASFHLHAVVRRGILEAAALNSLFLKPIFKTKPIRINYARDKSSVRQLGSYTVPSAVKEIVFGILMQLPDRKTARLRHASKVSLINREHTLVESTGR